MVKKVNEFIYLRIGIPSSIIIENTSLILL